jgi:hypothetical protein
MATRPRGMVRETAVPVVGPVCGRIGGRRRRPPRWWGMAVGKGRRRGKAFGEFRKGGEAGRGGIGRTTRRRGRRQPWAAVKACGGGVGAAMGSELGRKWTKEE